MTSPAFAAALDGRYLVSHAVLTVGGTWEPGPGTQYPSMVVWAVNAMHPGLLFEVPVPYPASFGPVGGPDITADSYEQSVQVAVDWIIAWIKAHPYQTFMLSGYSQGGEAASRVLLWLQSDDGAQYLPNLVCGYTFGNPCRGADMHAPSIANPGEGFHGISPTLIIELPTRNGVVIWADYAHSKANGDAANDMYTVVPGGAVGQIMADVYTLAIQLQLGNFLGFCQAMLNDILKIVKDSGILGSLAGGPIGLFSMGLTAMIEFLTELISGKPKADATGTDAAVSAAVIGLEFMTAPGGPTGPHISYAGEIPGYSNLVAEAADFVLAAALAVPATMAA